MAVKTMSVRTGDGVMPVYLHLPEQDGECRPGPWPGVLLFMDGPGIRPALHEIAARLAASGYGVVLPDLFYRAGSYEPVDPKVVFTDPTLRAAHRQRFMATAGPVKGMSDTSALLEAMDGWTELAPAPYGAIGYCMGGRLALIAAGTFPRSLAVVASFHGGRLADDTPTSPHLLADRIRARVYVAGAVQDANFPDDMKSRLAKALADAGVNHEVTSFPARHGWVPADTPAHDPAEAAHHWRTLIPLLDDVLKPSPA